MRETKRPRMLVAASVLLAAATLFAFAPVMQSGFVDYDDDVYVSVNRHIQHGIGAAELRWAMTSFYASNWHPVTWISHMLDWNAYGARPGGHHVTSLLIHVAAVLTLFLALAHMTGASGRSAFAAALFAVHPLHVESVAWLAERKDVLCALFWFLAIAAYARSRRVSGPLPRLAVVVFAALALMSKPMAVTLPLTLLLLDFWPLGRDLRAGAFAAVREKAPLFALCAGSAILTVMAQHAGQSIATVAALPLGQRLGNAAVAAVWYLVKTVWPTGLAVFYPHPGTTLPVWKVAGALAVIALISAAAWRLRGARPYLLFGWLWYLVTLLPVIGIVQVGQQGMADRYGYVPLVGIFVAVAWGARDLLEPVLPRLARAGAAVAIVLALIAATRVQAGYWKDGEALFARALAVTKDNDVAHAHLGMLRAQQRRFDEADAHFREALRIHPGSALAHLDFGTNLVQLGKTDAALIEFRVALGLDPKDARVHTNLGGLLERKGDLAEAQTHFEEAVRLEPDFVAARIGLGAVLSESGRANDAIVQWNEALRLDPGSAEAHDRVGTALAQLGRNDEAYTHFTEAIRLNPRRADTQCNWGTALAAQSRYREAAAHFEEAIRVDPTLARAHFSLAAASLFLDDYAKSWSEARLAERYGMTPPPAFYSLLSAKMPEPR